MVAGAFSSRLGVWQAREIAGIYFATDTTGLQDPREGPVVWGLEQAAKPHRRAVGLGLGLCGLQVSGLSWV